MQWWFISKYSQHAYNNMDKVHKSFLCACVCVCVRHILWSCQKFTNSYVVLIVLLWSNNNLLLNRTLHAYIRVTPAVWSNHEWNIGIGRERKQEREREKNENLIRRKRREQEKDNNISINNKKMSLWDMHYSRLFIIWMAWVSECVRVRLKERDEVR